MASDMPPASGLVPREGLVTLAHVIYALHAFSAVTGIASSALVVTAFLTGWPSIIAVILNYVKRSEVRGTWRHRSRTGWRSFPVFPRLAIIT